MATRTTNKQNAVNALLRAGYTIIKEKSKKKDVDLVANHPSNPSLTVEVKVYSRMAFIRRIYGCGLFIVFTDDSTLESYLYSHDSLLNEFENIERTESWLSEKGIYTFKSISKEDFEIMKKYRL